MISNCFELYGLIVVFITALQQGEGSDHCTFACAFRGVLMEVVLVLRSRDYRLVGPLFLVLIYIRQVFE